MTHHLDGPAGTLTLLYGLPQGGFAPPEPYSVGPGAKGIVTADFDRDGLTDLAVTNNTRYVTVFYNTIPEPATLSLLAAGSLVLLRRRHRE